jgi:hypothetical protein
MKTINFHLIGEKMPEHGQEIWYINDDKFYNTHEFMHEKVEYSWEECDEKGKWTGTSICYYDNEETPLNCKLSCGLQDDVLWCSADDVWNMLPE